MAGLNFYELLNSTTTATFEELKRNYKQLILQCHPDKLQQHQQSGASAVEVTVNSNESDPNVLENSNFNAINEAWNTLKDPIKRKHYDAELLQTKFQTHSNIYATITLNDMQRTRVEMEEEGQGEREADTSSTDKETTATTTWSFAYAYNCRCGGQYLLDDDDDESAGGEQRDDRLKASEIIVECSECSLVIIVKPQ